MINKLVGLINKIKFKNQKRKKLMICSRILLSQILKIINAIGVNYYDYIIFIINCFGAN